MHNLNPRYTLLDYNVGQVKTFIHNLNPVELLDLCPRIVIPAGSLFYHSSKLSIDKLYTTEDNYPNKGDCYGCKYVQPLPEETVGHKPRIMELSVNPNIKVKNKCQCVIGQQERLYGNFNFLGNYTISLGKSELKSTEVLTNISDVRLVDLNFISIELGFSPKTFFLNGDEVKGEFSLQSVWQNYCKSNNLDGLVMIDLVDKQKLNLNYKSVLSCYNYKDGVVCPEFVMLNELGDQLIPEIGTNKLRLLGVIQLYDKVKLTRDQVEAEFQLLFNRIESILSLYNINLSLKYNPPITLFKTLSSNTTINNIINTLTKYIQDTGNKNDFFITKQDYNNFKDVIYNSDLTVLTEYQKYNLELYKEDKNLDLDISSPININTTLPKNNTNYYYKNNQLVCSYASDLLFDVMLNNIAANLNINTVIYINYHQLCQYNNVYTWSYLKDKIDDVKGKVKIKVKTAIDSIEAEIAAQFYTRCFHLYYKNSNIDIFNIILTYLLNNNNWQVLFRNKGWELFKTSFLVKPSEQYICHINQFKDFIYQVISYNNFITTYLYQLLINNNYILYNLEDYLPLVDQDFNIKLFEQYTKTSNLDSVYNLFNNLLTMDI